MGRLTPRVAPMPEKDPALRARLQPYLELTGGDLHLLNDLAWGFLQSNPGISSVLVGTKSVTNLKANVERALGGVDPDLVQRAVALG